MNFNHKPLSTAKNYYKKFVVLAGSLVFSSLYAFTAHADLNRARAYLEQGRTQEAILELEGDISADPNNAEARFLKGVALQAMKRHDEAIEMYSGLVNDFPELPEPWNNLAVLWADKQEFDKAEDALRAAIKTNKSYATAHENLGDIYTQRASIAYSDALSLQPPNSSAVEIKLSMIDNILLPPEARRQVVAQQTPANTRPVNTRPANTTPANTSRPVDTANTSAANNSAVRDAIVQWADAWSRRDVPGYLSYYANNFRPVGGASRTAWAKYRSERLKAPSFILVNVSDLRMSNNSDGSVSATFKQDYQSDGYKDKVIKTLRMVNTASGWKIVREQSKPL
ncbi:MAG: tetratricopeptide repeat protein [Gammaproteobacteria bacterium]|nr:tetratricopeptide repeat protein [Gammaproteobacteria bacterium]NNC97962.1 tetratricopeptide repeat protein [Gammaproteobacteria bacterium]NNM13775.1 tetratricopeptide repeat protein [Gammaproteobacteria bacterium]